jgi:hypothetical protein
MRSTPPVHEHQHACAQLHDALNSPAKELINVVEHKWADSIRLEIKFHLDSN